MKDVFLEIYEGLKDIGISFPLVFMFFLGEVLGLGVWVFFLSS